MAPLVAAAPLLGLAGGAVSAGGAVLGGIAQGNASSYQAAVARGALEVWMPRLDPAVAQEIEAKRISFTQARDAISPEGRKVGPLGPFDRARVRHWMTAMGAELAPIASWLP